MHNLCLKSKIKRSKIIILSYSFNFKSLRKSPLEKKFKGSVFRKYVLGTIQIYALLDEIN